MKYLRRIFVAALALATAAGAYAQATSPQLTYVLKQLDTASAKFQRATADFQWDYYERVVQDTTTQKGYIYFERDKGSTDMGAVLVDPNAGPKSKPIKVIQYQSWHCSRCSIPASTRSPFFTKPAIRPRSKASSPSASAAVAPTSPAPGTSPTSAPKPSPTTVSPSKSKSSTSSARTPTAARTSPTSPSGSTPRAPSPSSRSSTTPAGDYRTATYSNIKVNGNVHKDQFAIKKDKNTTIVNH